VVYVLSKNEYKQVTDYIAENRDQLVRLTQDLVKVPSVSGHENEVQQLIHSILDEMDIDPQFCLPDIEVLRNHPDFFETTSFVKHGYEDRPNVIADIKGAGGGRSLCLSGHIDVVSPEPLRKWNYDPWGGDVEENVLYGRGAGDMKGGVACIIFAVKALRSLGIKLRGDLQLETTIEEEDGGVGGVLYLRTVRPKTDAALIPEPSALTISLASAGVMYFRVKLLGVPAHAATAHFGVNAAQKAVPIIEALEELHKSRQERISYPTAEHDPRMKGRVTTINLGVVRAGDWPSTVPALCELEYRIGWPPGETREEVMQQVEETVADAARADDWLSENPPEIEWFGWKSRPHELSKDDSFVQTVRENVSRVTDSEPSYIGGSSGLDTRYFVHNGTPAVTCGPYAERIHSYDESVSIDSLVKTAQVIAGVMMDWCGVGE
jgi:acetylornithine deacetylase